MSEDVFIDMLEDDPEDEAKPASGVYLPEYLQHTIYEHGGSRLCFEKGKERKLVMDTYHDEKFAKAARAFVEQYFNNL